MSDERGLTIHQEASHLMPAMSMGDAVQRFNQLATFTREIMKDGIDFGTIPGTNKPTLLKPGAEKLTTFFGLSVRYEVIEKVEDWTGSDHGGEPFFYYWFRCQMYRGDLLIAEADGSCNSMESKYRWRWVSEDDIPQGYDKVTLKTRRGSMSEFTFAVDKAETTGQYGKPPEYWQQFKDAIENGTATRGKRSTKAGKEYDTWEIDSTVYRVPNEDVFSQVNTVQKMAQKRALVAATMLAVNASEYYTQDLEDLTIEGNFTVSPEPVTAAPAAPTNGGRPLSPDKLRPGLRNKAGWHKIGDDYKRITDGEPITEKQVGLVAGRIEALFPNLKGGSRTKARYEVMGYLYGITSTHDLSKLEASALIDWTEDVDAATQEAAQIINALALEAGQQELEL